MYGDNLSVKSGFGSRNGGSGNLDLGHLNSVSDLESESEARNPFMDKVAHIVPDVHNLFPIIASGTTDAAAGQRLQPNKNSNNRKKFWTETSTANRVFGGKWTTTIIVTTIFAIRTLDF
jgi:hypothetical protein